MTKEDIIKEFTSLNGIGKAKAELLYEAGFDSLEKLKSASVQDIISVKGITEKNAKEIKEQLTAKKIEDVGKKETEKEAEAEEVEIVEEEEKKEGEYRVKKKPELSNEQKKKILIRKQIKKRTPDFLREEWFRYKRIPKNWRKPDGITSKMRINLKYRPSNVRVGFRGPKEVRNLHPSGFEEIIVYNVSDLKDIDPKKQAARIGSTVGTKKRIEISKRAKELDIRILNMKV